MVTRPIPFARNSSHYVHIRNCLLSFLNDIKSIPNLGAKILWVSCRLNRTGELDSPVFVGWVEDVEAANIRLANGHPYEPVEIRFADTNRSALFSECLKAPAGKVVERDWNVHKVAGNSQRVGERYYRETHRRSVPVAVKGVYAGTLNAAFLGNPGPKEAEIRSKLIQWGQGPNSQLVEYIGANLDFSGPRQP